MIAFCFFCECNESLSRSLKQVSVILHEHTGFEWLSTYRTVDSLNLLSQVISCTDSSAERKLSIGCILDGWIVSMLYHARDCDKFAVLNRILFSFSLTCLTQQNAFRQSYKDLLHCFMGRTKVIEYDASWKIYHVSSQA